MELVRKLDATGFPLLLARIIVGFTFLYYGAEKIGDPVPFLNGLKGYDVLPLHPSWVINSLVVVLPWIEVMCAAALLSGIQLRSAALLTTVMLVVFTPLILNLGLSLVGTEVAFESLCDVVADCGCGSGKVRICPKLASNCGLLALSLWALLSRATRFRGGLGG